MGLKRTDEFRQRLSEAVFQMTSGKTSEQSTDLLEAGGAICLNVQCSWISRHRGLLVDVMGMRAPRGTSSKMGKDLAGGFPRAKNRLRN